MNCRKTKLSIIHGDLNLNTVYPNMKRDNVASPNPQHHLSLPCNVSGGTFPTERWIKVDAELNRKIFPITAFVPMGYVKDPTPNSDQSREGFVRVRVSFKNNGHTALIFPGELLSVSNPVRGDSSSLTKVSKP